MNVSRVSIIAVSCLALACADSGTEVPAPTPDELVAADIAVVTGDAVYEDVGVVYAQLAAFNVPTGDIGRVARLDSPCPYDAATGRFVCPVRSGHGRTVTRSYGFRDAAGVPQAAYDAMTTASANFRTTMTGEVQRDGWSATIAHERDITTSGLLGAETQHTINGTGASSQTRSRHVDGGVRTYSMSSVATFADVVVPVPRTRGAWPVSGTITRQVTATREGDEQSGTFTRTSVTTFNGTRFAALTIGDRQFTLDLATGRVQRRH